MVRSLSADLGGVMRVSSNSLDVAMTHIIAKGDTDIFPPAFEFNAILDQWTKARAYLASQDLDSWAVRPLRDGLSPKRRLGFRIATQLDPLDTILITALIYEIGHDLESVRIPAADDMVHSYRFGPTPQGQLYLPEFNFDSFRMRSLELAETAGLVVMTDIADFFPRLYFHPLENALAAATSQRDHVRVILKMLKGWNQNVSYGVPVGPSVFRLLAEVTINDVDRSLLSEGFTFCRFSDDYRIFVPDERRAREALAFLADTLFRNHGLTLQESKTEIVEAADFIERFDQTEEDAERASMRERFDVLRQQLNEKESQAVLEAAPQEADEDEDEEDEDDFWVLLPMIDTYSHIEYEDLTEEQKAIVDNLNLWEVLRTQLDSTSSLDIPLVRFVLSRVAELELQDEEDLLLSDLHRLHPVFPQLVQALAVQGSGDEAKRHALGDQLLQLLDHPVVGHLEYHRNWILRIFSDPSWNQADKLPSLYTKYWDQLTRPEIVAALGAAGLDHWFRAKKRSVAGMPPWEKRAFLAGARCLQKDEASHWYRSVLPQLDPLEEWVARWALSSL